MQLCLVLLLEFEASITYAEQLSWYVLRKLRIGMRLFFLVSYSNVAASNPKWIFGLLAAVADLYPAEFCLHSWVSLAQSPPVLLA